MEQYINDHGKPCWRGVELSDKFSEEPSYGVVY